MTVLGVLSVLGSAQAAAQTIEHARYNAAGTTVTVKMTAMVEVSGGTLAPGVFTFPGTTHTVSATNLTSAVDEFELTVTPGLTQSAILSYTQPALDTAARIVASVGGLPVASQSATVLPVDPEIQLVANVSVPTGVPVDVTLPAAVGGVPPIVYTLTGTGGSALPVGLVFDGTPTMRKLTGTPTTAGRTEVVYTATDSDTRGANVGTVNFYIEVTVGPAVGSATGQVTAVGIEGSTRKTIGSDTRLHVIEGDLTNVTVTGRWTNAQLTQLWGTRLPANPPDPAEVTIAVASLLVTLDDWLSPAETNERPGDAQFGGRDAVLATTTVMVPIPAKPTTNKTSTLYAASGTGETSISFPHDVDAENEAFVINVGPRAGLAVPAGEGTSQSIPVVIEDDETQGITITRPTAQARTAIHEKSKTVTFNATAVPRREDLPLQVRYDLTDLGETSVSSRLYTLNSSVGTIPTGNLPANVAPVVVNIPGNDLNREDDELEIHAEVVSFSLASGAFTDVQSDSAAFTVLDVHRLPLLSVAPATGTVMEGGEIELTVTIDRNPSDTTSSTVGEQRLYSDEAVNIMLSPGAGSNADTADYTITPNPVSFAKRATRGDMQTSMKVKIEAVADDDIGEEMLVLDFAVAPTAATNAPLTDTDPYPAASSLTITDGTTPLVSVKEGAYPAIQAELGTPPTMTKGGMSGELMTTDLFEYDATAVDVTFGVSVDTGAVMASTSGNMVTITATEAGEAKVTITATAAAKASSLIITQDRANVAQLTFPVTVVLSDLSVTVAANPMEIMEGGMSAITATASRMIEASDGAVKIDLVVIGDATLSADSITIAAGSMAGSAMVTATEDDDDYMDETVTVVASGSGLTGTTQLTIAVTDNDEAPVVGPAVTAKSQAVVDAAIATAVNEVRNEAGLWLPDPEYTTNALPPLSELFDFAEGADISAGTGRSSDESVAGAWVHIDPENQMYSHVGVGPEGSGTATITATVAASAPGAETVAATIEFSVTVDTLPLSVGVTASAAMVAEGASVTITATANKMVDAATEVMLTRDASSTAGEDDYTVESLMIAAGEMTGTATLMATDDYDVEGNESLTLSAMVGGMNAGMVMVTIEDNDAETTYMVSADPMMVMEGGTVTITATASQMVRANTEVMVVRDGSSTAGADDYTVSVPLITIMMGETTGSLTLTATDDLDVEGDESLTLNGMVGDMNAGSVMITINDNDVDSAFTLSGPADMNLVEGESYELTVMADPAVQMETTIMIMRDRSMSDADDADYTVEPVVIMAGESTGTTMLMVTEDSMDDAGSGMPEMLVVFGMVDGMETNSLTFYTWDMAVPALPLIAQLLLAAFLAIGGYRRYLRR